MDTKGYWLKQIDELFSKKPKEEIELFLDIVEMSIYNKYSDTLSLFYREFGLDNFLKFVNYFSGKTIKVPDYEELKENIVIALCYYYKEMKGYNWEKIKEIFPYKEINSIKYGKNINKLKDNIQKEIYEIFKEIEIEDIKNEQ